MATITWASADITGDLDVSTRGEPVFAISGSDSTGIATVNGVDFLHTPRTGADALAQSQSPGNESLTTTIGNDNTSAFETGGLGAVGQIIRGGWWGTTSGTTATITLTGLTVGDIYEVQIFANDARSSRHNGYISALDNGEGGIGVDLSLNNQPTGDLAGDFGTGTFTADSSTQSFTISGFNGNPNAGRVQANAIQLRKLDTLDPPDPPDLLPGAVPLINEFSASNSGVLDDDNGNSTDWIEIYNAGEDTVDLGGYRLTDDPTIATKYVIPNNTTLAGGQYLIVFAGDDADPTTGTDLYTSFGLASGGDYLGFFDPAGSLVNEFGVGGVVYPAQFTNVSYGIEDDGTFSEISFFATPTPGSANLDPVVGVIEGLPTVSVDRGFYEQAFTTIVKSTTPGATLVYTTDGSEPSLSNGTQVAPANSTSLAQTSIFISETTSLRTGAFKTDFHSPAATTHTYVFLDDVIASDLSSSPETNATLRESLLDIPTLSFNYETVISNSSQLEQLASIEWLAPDGSPGFQIDGGIKGFGGYFTNFAKKNFRVNFRSQYGESKLDFPLFEGFDNGIEPATEGFDSLDFRSGSHDMVARGFYMSNRFVDDTMLELGHVAPHGRFVHIYTNGVYWGQYHMRERWDADFLSQYYGGDADDYEAVNGNINNGNQTPGGWAPGEVYDGTGALWDDINTYFPNNQGSTTVPWPTNDALNYQQMRQVVNLEQYIDYMLIYMAGSSENEYRAGGSTDGLVPYSFTLNDADGWLRGTSDRTNNAGPGDILGGLVAEGDPEFMILYRDRIANMFGEDGALSPARSVERLQDRLDEIDNSFHAEAARWGYRSHSSWESEANEAINDMLPNIAGDMIANFQGRGIYPNFDAPSYQVNNSALNGGDITPGDSLTITAEEAIYYTIDGTDPRLVGGGISPNAFAYDPSISTSAVFAYGSDWKYLDDGSNQGTAWRSPSFNDNSWAEDASELGYGDNPATTISFGGDPDNKHTTTYFRKTFSVTESFDNAELDLFYDDGAVVYLNGNEIGRVNIAGNVGDPVDYQDFATGTSGDGTRTTFDLTGSLVAGTNILAVEVHQTSLTSSDVSFNAGLSLSTNVGNAANIVLATSTNVQSRAFSNGEWSGIRDETFLVPGLLTPQSDLRITELHYNPLDPTASELQALPGIDNNSFEFVELMNVGTALIELNGVQFTDGIVFTFSGSDDVLNLAPGETVLLVQNRDAFELRYGTGFPIAGEYGGGLSGGGEAIILADYSGVVIDAFAYIDQTPWPVAADGVGPSLEIINPLGDSTQASNWHASTIGGTPGVAPVFSGLVCDFVGGDDGCDIADIDALYAGTNGAPTPLTNTLIIQWLSDASDQANPLKPDASTVFVLGDVDLNGDVDSTDLGLLLNNFGSAAGLGWGAGNLSSDASVDSTDLGLLLNNFGFSSAVNVAAGSASIAVPNDETSAPVISATLADDFFADEDEDEETSGPLVFAPEIG